MIDLVHANLENRGDNYEKFLIYFNSIINYAIWKVRNEIKFEFKSFNFVNLVNKINRSLRGRKNVDEKLLVTRKIPFIRDLCSTFSIVSRRYMPYDNG